MSTTCSCTQCIYNPKHNTHKSKIDKLYRSKYLPHRQRALLDKLVKTRAAYDELRDQILSGRTDDDDSEYGSYGSDDFDEPDKSVVKIVDLVDKGQFPLLKSSVNLHSECCECCYCSSKIKINKHRKAYHALPTDTQLRKTLEIRKHKTRRDRNAVKFRAVRSEPCLCTLKFSDLKNISRKIRHISSKEIFKRKPKEHKEPVELSFTIESPSRFKKTRDRIRESLRSVQTHITSKETFKRKPKKYKEPVECECIPDDELSFTIESPSKFKKTRDRIRESLHSVQTHITSKEIFKRKPKEYKNPVECECIPDDELSFAIESPSKFKKTQDRIRESLHSIQTHITSKEIFKRKPKEYKNPVECECIPDGELRFMIENSSKLRQTRNKIRESLRSFKTSSEELYRKLSLKRKKYEVGDFESFDEYYEKYMKPSLTERSKMKIKQTRDKFRDSIRSSASKLENAFRIKKDSIMLFKEKLKRKKALKAWACDPDFCVPNMDECIPEECYEKIKIREAKRMKQQQVESYKPEVESYQSQVSVISFRIDPKQKEELRPETKQKSRRDKVICECRTKTKSKSSMTRHSRRRTQKSMSDSIITSSNKKTDTLSGRVPNKKKHLQYSMNESDRMTNLPNAASKQAVKISSSFKFEIEFYKDKVPPVQNESNRTEREYDSQKHYKSAGENDKVLKYNSASAQHSIRVQKKNTQTIDISSAEKLPFPRECDQFMCDPGNCNPRKCAAILLKQSKGNHELQRCFCTLGFQKSPKRQDKKYSMTRPIKLEQVSDSISTQTTKNSTLNTSHTLNLLPYECEPDVCIPGECNPMICYERIKKRNSIKNKSINTLTQRTKRRDVKSISATKSRPVGTKVRAPMQRKRFSRQKSGLPSVPVEKSLSSSTTLNRQVVRIGSSFKFDIEFYKNTNNPDENVFVPEDRVTKDNRKEIRNSSSLRKRDSDSTKSEQSGVKKSFLKRCFCTKQFRKKSKVKIKKIKRRSKMIMTDIKKKKSRQHQTKVVKCECDNESEKPLAKTRASMTSTVVNYVIPPTHHLNGNLLPNECEPFFCTPGKCDPYVCLERIKSRNIKRIKTHSKDLGTMSKKSTVTSVGNKYSSKKVQAIHAARRKNIGHVRGVYDRRVHGSIFDKKEACISKSSPSPPRQGIRIGSSFRFDIEFYKTNQFPESTIPEKKGENKIHRNFEETNVRKPKLKTKGIGDYAEVRSQTSGTKDSVKSKISLTTPLQRCFCTLKFNKKPKQKVTKSVSKSTTASSRIRMIICKCKVASTQTPKQTGKSKLHEDNLSVRSNLLPYECEPNFCVPGKCDPYVCYERIKSRNLLKRCFCTLKLNKSSKTRGSATRLKNVMRTAGTETVQEKHRRQHLLPYECSPGVCDPGNCNPYKCLELIKKRNAINISHRDRFASTYRPVRKSSFSETSRTRKKSQSTLNIPEQRVRKDKHSKTRKDRHQRQNNAINNKNIDSSHSSVSPQSKTRQAVRIGSNFTFNIQFSRNKAGNIKRRTSSDNFVSASDKKMSQIRRAHVDKSSNLESKRERCFCTLKFHKRGRRNRDNRLYNDLEISRNMNDRKLGKHRAMEVTRERHYKRHRRHGPQGRNMINITREERHRKQKETQKPPVEQPKETVQQPQETVFITREVKEIKPEPPPVQYEYVYHTVKYSGEGNAPVVTEVNASQVDVNKLAAAGQIPAK